MNSCSNIVDLKNSEDYTDEEIIYSDIESSGDISVYEDDSEVSTKKARKPKNQIKVVR